MNRKSKMSKGLFSSFLGLIVIIFGTQALAAGDSWDTKEPMPTARFGPAGAAIGGLFYVAGGGWLPCVPAECHQLEVYDPAFDSWNSLASMDEGRNNATVAAFNGQLFVFGGDYGGLATSTVFVYTPEEGGEGTWTTSSTSTPVPINGASAAVLNDEIYLVGGTNSPALHIYDPPTDTWRTGAPMPVSLTWPSIGVIGGRLYVAGGYDYSQYKSKTYEYDPLWDSWEPRASAPNAWGSAAFAVLDDKLYVAGGSVPDVGAADYLNVYTPPTIESINSPPVIVPIAPKEALEYDLVEFPIIAIDPDVGDSVVLSSDSLPDGAVFTAAIGVFSWVPRYDQAGEYVVTFHATDNGEPSEADHLDVTITINDIPPTDLNDVIIETFTNNLDLPKEVIKSYMANLKKVNVFIEKGKITPASNQLNSFINKVNKDMAKGILNQADGQMLIDMANEVLNKLSQ